MKSRAQLKENWVSFSFFIYLLFLEIFDLRDPKKWQILQVENKNLGMKIAFCDNMKSIQKITDMEPTPYLKFSSFVKKMKLAKKINKELIETLICIGHLDRDVEELEIKKEMALSKNKGSRKQLKFA